MRHPYELSLIETDPQKWLKELARTYSPQPMEVCEIPKAGGTVRPGSLLSVADHVIYTALVGECLPYISKKLAWSQGTVDFAYRLGKSDEVEWLRNQFLGWRDFINHSLKIIDDDFSYVLFTDISACYENISLKTLLSDLRQLDIPDDLITKLGRVLDRWTQIEGRGLPQGISASHILAKLYLNSIDERLYHLGIRHVRYVDDYRLFFRSSAEAKRGLLQLSAMLRGRGLNLQTAKSEILNLDQARTKIEGVAPILRRIDKQYRETATAELGLVPYLSTKDIDKALTRSPDDTPLEVIRKTYRLHFVEDASQFDKTLFHYLLNRMRKAGDAYATDHVLSYLEPRPEETEPIVSYLLGAGVLRDKQRELIEFLQTDSGQVYPYQAYLILSSIAKADWTPDAIVMSYVREKAVSRDAPRYLRAISRMLLGKHGTPSDLEGLMADYPNAATSLEQSEIMCSVVQLEKSRRNRFLSQVKGDGVLNELADRFVRSNRSD